MYLAVAVLANNAHVGDDGLLYVSGGGWEHYTISPEMPLVRGVFAGVIDFGEPLQEARVQFSVAQDGQDPGSHGSMTIRSERKLAPLAMPFALPVDPALPPVVRFSFEDDDGPLWQFELPITVLS